MGAPVPSNTVPAMEASPCPQALETISKIAEAKKPDRIQSLLFVLISRELLLKLSNFVFVYVV
jgi:hypothetical protein